MGGCASVHKDSAATAMKAQLSFGSNNPNTLIPSPFRDKPPPFPSVDRPIAGVGLQSHWSQSPAVMGFGSKDEKFFDSQPWLESDCEDDFFSVNGDFTPSRGNTPVHHRFSVGTPTGNRTPVFKPEPSPTPKKKRLSDLFRESLGRSQDFNLQNLSNHQNAVNGNGTPFVSGGTSVCSSSSNGTTPSSRDVSAAEKDQKHIRSSQCCLPSMLSSRRFSEGKKKTSPVESIG